jgi:ClpP class serine protease
VSRFPRYLATGLFNAPLAMLPAAAPLAVQLLEQAVGLRADGGAASDVGAGEEWGGTRRGPITENPYDVIAGVAVIPVKGVLFQQLPQIFWDLPWLCELYGIEGYDRLRYKLMRALDDRKVDAIAFDENSGGGDVAGCFDFVDTIYRARGRKPIAAILGECAYSAAYAIASAADPGRVWVPRTGGTGSVGVIYIHLSVAEWLTKAGIAPTLVTAGALKGEGSELLKLSEGALERLQADVDTVGKLFHQTVARNRGMSVADVAKTQAGTFLGSAGVDVGFADAVASPDEAFRALLKQLG